MTIYIKALELQNKIAMLDADKELSASVESYETAKKTLKTAFDAMLQLPNGTDLAVLTAKGGCPSDKARKKYRQWLIQADLVNIIGEASQKKEMNISESSLIFLTNLVRADERMQIAYKNLPERYQEYRIAKKECKGAVLEALRSGKTPSQILTGIKNEAYRAKNHTLNYRVLDIVSNWSQKNLSH